MEVGIKPSSHSQPYPSRAIPYNPFITTPKTSLKPFKPKTSLKPFKPKTSLKPLSLSNSLKTSFNFNHGFIGNEPLQEENLDAHHVFDKIPDNFNLPIVIRHSVSVSRYFWDGQELKLVSVDGINTISLRDFSVNFGDGVRKLGRVCGAAVRNFFLPREVTENYLEYVKWKFLHRVFSSALQVLATQAMFRAIGIGYSRSLPSAAALNWVLKDGLGRLSRCIYTATLASAFDTNLKRVRFSTSVLFSLSIGVELLTPVFPKYFLLLATMANIAKQISLACYLATGSAVHRSFAIADNLGEISAKAQIQTVCFDNIGLLLAATLNILFRNNQRLLAALPFVVYPIFSTLDLFGIYQGLKHVHLQTLTKDRLESIINIWIQLGYIPSPAEVSKMEGIDFLRSKGSVLSPIRIGCLNPKAKVPKLSMMTLKSLNDKDLYFICIESFNSQSVIRDVCSFIGVFRLIISIVYPSLGLFSYSILYTQLQHGILLCLREGAGTSDVIMGLLQACYIRKGLLLDGIGSEEDLESCTSSVSVIRNWFRLLKESKRSAQNDVDIFIDKMSGLGWACKNILLSPEERVRYSFVAD